MPKVGSRGLGMGTANARTFGNLLRHYRLRAGLTQAALGERAGVSGVTVGQLERGVWKSPRTDTANLLADALGLDEVERRELFTAAGEQRPRRGPRPEGEPIAPAPHPLLGREGDLAALDAMLANPAIRAVTLVGPGGIGKTRLAAELARNAARAGRRVISVPLLDEPGPIPLLPAIARAAGVQAGPDVHATLARALGRQDVLVVLDNAEDRIAAGDTLGALLEALPRLTVLATSREPLGLAFEHRYPLAPLALPEAGGAGAAVRESPAAALFIARAGLANARLGQELAVAGAEAHAELDAVAAIVRAVDGMPLAIEIAAAYAETMSPRAIATLLEAEGIAPVADGRAGVGRGEGMGEVIRWSVDRIAPDAAGALGAAAVFAGGFAPDAFGRVVGAALPAGSRPPGALLPDLLRSWLAREAGDGEPGGPVRFRIPEPVRQHALVRLRASGEEARARAAHLAWAMEAIPDLAARFEGPDPESALPGLLAEMPNALAAIDAALAGGDGVAAASLALPLVRAWDFLNMQGEGRRRLQRILAADGLPPATAGDLLWWSAYFADLLGMSEEQRHDIERLRAQADPGDAAAGAMALVAESGLSREPAGAPGSSRELLLRARDLVESEPPSFLTWAVLVRLATETAALGMGAEALDVARAARADAAARNHGLDLAFADLQVGAALVEAGRWDEAREALRTSLRASLPLRYAMVMLLAEMNLARVAAASDDAADLAHAARLLGAADRVLVRHGYDYGHIWERIIGEIRARIAAAFGAEAMESLIAEGRALSEGDGVAMALGE